jgi:hypothetical protein
MRDEETRDPVEQLQMPGMPSPGPAASSQNVAPGTEVLYTGYFSGGPRHGARGVIKRASDRRAFVDMGRSGLWHIPYYFLSVHSKAA